MFVAIVGATVFQDIPPTRCYIYYNVKYTFLYYTNVHTGMLILSYFLNHFNIAVGILRPIFDRFVFVNVVNRMTHLCK